MEPPRWNPPSGERDVGLGFYATNSPPVPGRIKATAEDFEVQEISSYPLPDPRGQYAVLRVRSRDWEQHELAQRIASRLGLAPHAISWAGTKDRRAVSERLFSYRGQPPDRELGLPDVTVLESYRARDGVVLGHHYGNTFAVRISDLGEPPEPVVGRFERCRDELRAIGGFANFFGLQRFGEVRPVTHLVGRDLVRGDPAAAVETYLTYLTGDADTLGAAARRQYALDHDAARAQRDFPPSFQFEKRLLDHLTRGHSPERALGSLSRELRKLFVHAYQALLFNRWLSERWAAGIPLDTPEAGDRLLRRGPDGTVRTLDPIPVSADNRPECRDMVARGRAVVAGPLVGYETVSETGPVGRLLEGILTAEGVAPRDFQLPKTPELASAGSWRPALVSLPPISFRGEEAAEHPDGHKLGIWVGFSLPKGSYATVLLREFLKAGAMPAGDGSNRPF
ncbi:MAG: tRNA pseudouridine(13) synthase TruD [Thermoplasmata archaeon]|nr:tRNA pseudouridine(13) synthase TruD [Thermoplasmata archaeon]MCI4359398.1 tRNA pseudouridine(13) synthase TruD [Thermoplasmata archaeon]